MLLFLAACNNDNLSGTPEHIIDQVKINVIETENYKVAPVTTPQDIKSYGWSQTCGIPVLSEEDKTSFTFNFTAPELHEDQQYCFEFNATTSKNTKYTTKTTINVVAPTLELYIDNASLPTLHQLMHIIESYEENLTRTRFISWGRVSITDEQVRDMLNISTFPLVSNNTSQKLVDAVKSYAQSKNRLNIEIYSNTTHALKNIKPIISSLSGNPNVNIAEINLYDDGSAEYINLYNWKNTPNKIDALNADLLVMKDYVEGYSTQSPSYMSSRYNWHKLYDTEYHFLRADYLTIEPNLNDLRDYLGNSLEQMDWGKFEQLSKAKQQLFLSIVGFDKDSLEKSYANSPNKNFVFTGTTTWAGNETREFYAKQQINVINNAINETSPLYLGEEYDLFFKGHPRGGDINNMILNAFKDMINIPASISFEVLMMTGSLPDKVAGIASSLYFTIPAEKVDFIVFTSSDDITDREEALKSPLVQVMMKLGIVEKQAVQFWSDLPNCESGVCINN